VTKWRTTRQIQDGSRHFLTASLHHLSHWRVRIGNVKLADLPDGQRRYLRTDERF